MICPGRGWLVGLAGSLAAALLSGCSSLVVDADPHALDGSCHVSSGFEPDTFGCAEFLIVIEPPSDPLTPLYLWWIRARTADGGFSGTGNGSNPLDGQAHLRFTLYSALPGAAGDTASVWVVARILEDVRPVIVGEPLPVFAADSALRVAVFAAPGEVPAVDTVRLSLRTGSGQE